MKTIVIEATPCPSCGRLLPAGALAGLCPACLLAQGAQTDAGDGGKRFQPPPIEEIARLFPQLEILGLLGAGGMGAVYKARQPVLDRLVALKILPASGAEGVNFEERFNREARALARLSHPNIVAVHEFGKADGLHFFLMEFVDGANLRQLEKAGRLAPREALQIIPQICDALQYAHDEGVVHRDIKPENVLVDRKGRVKIADFGLAKILGQDVESLRLTAEGQVMGTPHYMAPEQVERPLTVDHRADIYSLGVVFYEMLTGDLPLGKFSPPSRKFQLDVRLDDVVLRALENDPARRYQNASEVKSQVETIAAAPAPASSATPIVDERPLYWAGFPIATERGDERKVNKKERLRAWAIVLGLLTIAFAFVSAVTGRSLMGWLGLSGWPSLVVRAVIAAVIVAWGARQALNQPRSAAGSAILKPKTPWWRSRRVVVSSILLLIVTWTVFREGSSLLGLLKDRFHPSATNAPSVAAQAPETSASRELWSPALGTGEKPEPSKILNEAAELRGRGEYEQALQHLIWYHNHALEFESGLTGVRLSFALAEWIELGRRYPKARHALIEIRDDKTREFDEGRGYSKLFSDVKSINSYLQADEETVALFKRIHQKDPILAAECIHYARDSLIKSGEYQLCLNYLPDVSKDFNSLVKSHATDRQNAPPGDYAKSADSRFARYASRLILMLRGLGRTDEADEIRAKVAAILGDESLITAALEEGNGDSSRQKISIVSKVSRFPAPPAPSVSLETWAPTINPGEKLDLYKLMDEAKTMMTARDYESALQRFIWIFNHGRQHGGDTVGGIIDWVELGRRYPKARQALIEIRDLKAYDFEKGQGYFELATQLWIINKYLGEEDATTRLFIRIHQLDAALAQQCSGLARDGLVKNKEYGLFFHYNPDAQADFDRWKQGRQMEHDRLKRMPSSDTPENRRSADESFVKGVSQLIEMLKGAGRMAEAEKIRMQAAALVDVPVFQASVAKESAELKKPN